MRIGYACITLEPKQTIRYRTCSLKTLTPALLREVILHNLKTLEKALEFNIENQINFFRISSDIIPFASSPVNTIEWWKEYQDLFESIASNIKNNNLRVSMHPGQYTIINSPRNEVVENAFKDLEYHTRFLDTLHLDSSHKIILHIGGIYQDKVTAMQRFVENYKKLPDNVKKRLVIENDDKSYSIEEVLSISAQTGIPVVYDNLHNQVKPSSIQKSDSEWIQQCRLTWRPQDGVQKIHYSQQDDTKRIGSHSPTIFSQLFMAFITNIQRQDLDIMLEVKDKNISAIKVNNLLSNRPQISRLEKEWSFYKYFVLSRSQTIYQTIRQLLKDKTAYPVQEFYQWIEAAMKKPESKAGNVNAAQHMWGYFKDKANDKERKKFMNTMSMYEQGQCGFQRILNLLFQLTQTYHEEYLLNSYIFISSIGDSKGED